ncbi:Uncharacterised protein [Psychrobacter phenylpyruvicus]|uniref:Uncharacterized protein n=1 Tax=Psychrobacter phenylpyruvicus TaxID=29432 RepID=A0A379LIS8_9GAMM|nr:Uncharacterised protein [Psychrobacter phenylpyruvicus]
MGQNFKLAMRVKTIPIFMRPNIKKLLHYAPDKCCVLI